MIDPTSRNLSITITSVTARHLEVGSPISASDKNSILVFSFSESTSPLVPDSLPGISLAEDITRLGLTYSHVRDFQLDKIDFVPCQAYDFRTQWFNFI